MRDSISAQLATCVSSFLASLPPCLLLSSLLLIFSVSFVPSVVNPSARKVSRYIFRSSRRRLVCARLTGTSDPRLSAIFSV
jgi:hypothetical protein